MTQAPADTRLYAGQRLTLTEFFRRYEAQPDLHRVELLRGVVVMPSPVRQKAHQEPQFFMTALLLQYQAKTLGVALSGGSTIRLNETSCVEPDLFLRMLPEHGGQCLDTVDGYLEGPPEFIVEICASTHDRDLIHKRAIYEEAGVFEYIVWLTESLEFRWLILQDQDYVQQEIPADHILKSVAFPGLWIDLNACLSLHQDQANACLHLGLQEPAHAAFVEQLLSRRSKSTLS